MSSQHPLPRSSWWEWIGLVCGAALIAFWVITGHSGWWHSAAPAGLALLMWIGGRVRGRRIDAIRSRPPI